MICPRCGAEFDQERCPLCFYEPQVVEEVAVQENPDEQAEPTPCPIQMTTQTISVGAPQSPMPPVQEKVDPALPAQEPMPQQPTEPPVLEVSEQIMPISPVEEAVPAPGENIPAPEVMVEGTADSAPVEDPAVPQETETKEQEQAYYSCPRCGNVINGVYCPQCGYYQPQNTAASSFTENYAVYCEERNLRGKKPPLKNSSANKVWMILTIVAVGLLFLAYIVGVVSMAFYTAFSFNSEVFADGSYDEYYEQEWEETFPDFGNRDDAQSFFEEYFGAQDDNTVSQEQEALYPHGVSPQEYRQLELGMTYAQISAIIGGDGSVVESNGDSLLIYWSADTGEEGIGVLIEFQNQTAVAIEQRGLE